MTKETKGYTIKCNDCGEESSVNDVKTSHKGKARIMYMEYADKSSYFYFKCDCGNAVNLSDDFEELPDFLP